MKVGGKNEREKEKRDKKLKLGVHSFQFFAVISSNFTSSPLSSALSSSFNHLHKFHFLQFFYSLYRLFDWLFYLKLPFDRLGTFNCLLICFVFAKLENFLINFQVFDSIYTLLAVLKMLCGLWFAIFFILRIF